MLSLARLAVIARIAEQGTIVGAAQALGLTASAVSHQLSRLEKELGVSLVERGPRSLRLTDAGRRLAEHAVRVERQLHKAQIDMDAFRAGDAGRLRLGFFASGGLRMVPQALSTFLASHPDVELGLFPGQTHELVPSVHAGDLDLAVVFDHSVDPWPMPDGLVVDTVCHDEQYLVAPTAHPLVGRHAAVHLPTLATEPWIATHGLPPTPSPLERICAAAHVVPQIRCRTDHYEVALGLVRAGVGIALVPQMVLEATSTDGLQIARLAGPALYRRIMIVSRPHNPNPLAATFADILVQPTHSGAPGITPVKPPSATTARPLTNTD